MDRKEFAALLTEKVLILDGGMGALLQSKGLAPGEAPEAFLLKDPGAVEQVHSAYVKAGSDVILTCTFGASPLRLAESGLETRTAEINSLAVKACRRAAVDLALVAGDIGPSGKFLEPVGELSFAEAYANFHAQAKALAEAGVDLLIIETISDIREAKAATLAARDAFAGPIVVQMTFAEDGRTVTGTDAAAAHAVLSKLDIDCIGVNCSVGPAPMESVVKILCGASAMPVSVEPNAGLPTIVDGAVVYPESDDAIAGWAERFLKIGANLIGGCCGTTPSTIAKIAQKIKGAPPAARAAIMPSLTLSSRMGTVAISPGGPCVAVGERLNPTGRKLLGRSLKEGDVGALRKDATSQVEAGAKLLDLNCGVPGADEVALLPRAVLFVESVTGAPLVLDTTNHDALESALQASCGRVLINSVNGEEASLNRVLPLARRYGAAVIGLCLDERGIPATVGGRMEVARRICARAEAAGLAREDIVLDALTMAASTQAEGARVTIETIRAIGEELGTATILGVSNVSFGLPAREAINAAFLAQAISAGLSLAIINPLDKAMMQALHAANLLSGRDPACKAYLAHFRASEDAGGERDDSVEGRIAKAVCDGDREGIIDLLKAGMASGLSAGRLTEGGLVKGMEEVGRRFEKGRVFLPQVILSAETLKRGFAHLKEHLPKSSGRSKGKVVFATVAGDIHDIGKNICITLLESGGYSVFDAGKNVPAEEIVAAAERESADVIALSALMTTTMQKMPEVISAVRARGVKAKVVLGGAVVTRSYAESAGADGYGADAVECLKVVDSLMGKNICG